MYTATAHGWGTGPQCTGSAHPPLCCCSICPPSCFGVNCVSLGTRCLYHPNLSCSFLHTLHPALQINSRAQALLRELLIASEDKMQLMGGPEFVYIIAALAKLRAAPDQAWLNRWLAVSRHRLSLLGPSQLVMCTRALCRLDMQPG